MGAEAGEVQEGCEQRPSVHRNVSLWLMAGAMATGAGALAFGTGLMQRGAFVHSVHVPWLLLLFGFALTARFTLDLHFRTETHTMTLDEIVLVVGFFVV